MSHKLRVPIKDVSVGDFYNTLRRINEPDAWTLIVHEDNKEIMETFADVLFCPFNIITHPAVHINEIFVKDKDNTLIEIISFYDGSEQT